MYLMISNPSYQNHPFFFFLWKIQIEDRNFKFFYWKESKYIGVGHKNNTLDKVMCLWCCLICCGKWSDIGKLTMKTVDDVRTLNTNVHFRPSCNLYNMNELASLWETKIGRTLPRVTITESDLLAAAAGTS